MRVLNPAIGFAKPASAIQKPFSLGVLLSLLFICARTTADPLQAQLPVEVTFNSDAGRGGWIFVALRMETGEELPFLVDTGTPVTVLDNSLEAKLGKRLSEGQFTLSGITQDAGEYRAPKLWCGGTPLVTGTNVVTCDLERLFSHAYHPHAIRGILGTDCLRHYCIRIDFQAAKMRLLNPHQLDASVLGKAYPLILTPVKAGPTESILPFINHAGLSGGTGTNTLVDTGVRIDGIIEKGTARGHYWQRFTHLFRPSRAKLRLAQCVWDGQTYTRVCVDEAKHGNTIGLRFLARHLVTLDFPDSTMYLKQTSVSPLP